MKILSVEQMREVERRSVDLGIPEIVLMENAGCRVVEFLAARFAPLEKQRIVVICGKGNNGGDGLVIARQLFLRFRPAALDVVLSHEEAVNLPLLRACGFDAISLEIAPRMRAATLVVDALLGTGMRGPASGRALELIREMNSGFPGAAVVSVDLPSGLCPGGESVLAVATITFTAPKIAQVMPPLCDRVGELHVVSIGSPEALMEDVWLELNQPAAPPPRKPGGHKGDYGHVLVVGGAAGKGGAAAMAGLAALRSGAGLVTVASEERAGLAPELMTQSWRDGYEGKDVVALGPGMGLQPDLARRWFSECPLPMLIDADGLNSIAGWDWPAPPALRVLTPHPGEMARLTGVPAATVQADRLGTARSFAMQRGVALVLKGQRTLIAWPDGRVWVNPAGTPAMATAGSGDVLTGMIAAWLAQLPAAEAVCLAVWLHGRAGELAARALGEPGVIATDLLRYLPDAWHALSHKL